MDVLNKMRRFAKARQQSSPPSDDHSINPGQPLKESTTSSVESELFGDTVDNNRPAQRQIKAIIIGAGQRGQVYASYASDFPEKLTIVGVAEPIHSRRNFMCKKYRISEDCVFKDWKQIAEKEKFADAVVIATLDHQHKDPAVAFANLGYDILLEKPMAQTVEECEEIVSAVKNNSVILAVAHVMRYTPRIKKVKEIIASGLLGDVISIQHMEPVGWFHFAHSFVRGSWRRKDESSFSLLTKCCHDIDLIHSLLQESKCVGVSSFGSLAHFTSEHKPTNASNRCLTCEAEADCPYSAVKIYLKPIRQGYQDHFTKVACNTIDIEEMQAALQDGPYGRCVYDCDNDVMSNQVVNMTYDNGALVSFIMSAFTEKVCMRETKIFGSRGQMECSEGSKIFTFDFTTRQEQSHSYQPPPLKTSMSNHGFGDYYMMDAFVRAVATQDPSMILSNPDDTLASHRLVFDIERSRLENKVVNPQL